MSQLSFIQRMTFGWQLAKVSYGLINQHKSTLVFTLLSATLLLAVTAAGALFSLPYLDQLHSEHIPQSTKIILATLSFCYLMLLTIISTSMSVSLSYYVSALLQHQPASISHSINRSLSRLGTIIAWSFFATVIATLVRALQNKNNAQSFGSRIVLSVLGSVIKLAWGVLTYFVTPVIALEDQDIIESIKRSGNIMTTTWGEAVGAQFMTGLYSFLIILCTIPLAIFFGIFGIALMLLIISTLILINATVSTVIKTALYHYAVGKPTGMFPPALLKQAFAQTDKL